MFFLLFAALFLIASGIAPALAQTSPGQALTPTLTPAPDPLAGLVVDYASLAIVASILTKALTWCYKEFKGQELPGRTKNAIAGLTCLLVTVYYLYTVGAFQSFSWQSLPAIAALFAVVVTIASNLYDKVLHPVSKSLKGQPDNRPEDRPDDKTTDNSARNGLELNNEVIRGIEADVDRPAV